MRISSRLKLSQKAACADCAHLQNNKQTISLRIWDYFKTGKFILLVDSLRFLGRFLWRQGCNRSGKARLPKLRQIRAIKLFCGLQSSSQGGHSAEEELSTSRRLSVVLVHSDFQLQLQLHQQLQLHWDGLELEVDQDGRHLPHPCLPLSCSSQVFTNVRPKTWWFSVVVRFFFGNVWATFYMLKHSKHRWFSVAGECLWQCLSNFYV